MAEFGFVIENGIVLPKRGADFVRHYVKDARVMGTDAIGYFTQTSITRSGIGKSEWYQLCPAWDNLAYWGEGNPTSWTWKRIYEIPKVLELAVMLTE